MEQKTYDIAIIGAGAGGLTAAIYAVRAGRSVVVIEKGMIGGQIALTNEVSNYPGFTSITGFELSLKMHEHAQALGTEFIYDEVVSVDFNNTVKTITTNSYVVTAKAVIISTGARARKLGVENEDKFTGSGVAYCAVCDGAFYKGKNVVLVGGGNTAVEDAIYLSKIASHITIVNITEKLQPQQIILDELNEIAHKQGNIDVINNSTITKLIGQHTVTEVEITNVKTKQTQNLKTDGVFVAIGRLPETEFLKNSITLDNYNYIITDEDMQTSLKGVYACGDVRAKKLRQIVTATSDGATAATNASSYINSLNNYLG